ncbi:MAG TPA: carboxypeptidase-like regulatory domain-containing protein, partial [Saprospiraceae bacterium]|nr:carboxypeptidase-like regulatory domain-containing protein [Saprospiraceae bacterium]
MRTLACLLIPLLATTLSAQKITGYVRDSIGEAIPFASVVATSCHHEQVLAYTSTDERGRYQISIKATDCDTIALTARGLGYRTGTVRLPGQQLPAAQDFVLASTALQEVVIRAKTPPVVARRDTTEYDVKSFSDSTEFSVEDLLKKLPGVKVSEQGIVTYNGKTVERVLIEGDDVFSQNYPLATRNIRADMISKVQVIDRYQENPLMKGIQESDRMVMNLKIKPDRKRTLSGSVAGGLGYGDELKARAHTNLFSLSRKDKIYCIGNANNTGENPLSEVDFLSRGDVFDPNRQALQNSPLQVSSLLQTPAMQRVGLPQAYTQANRSGVFYLGDVLPVSPHVKLKTSAWLGGERLRQQSASHTRYLLDCTTLDIAEAITASQQRSTRNLQSEAEYYSPDKKRSLRSFLKFSDRPAANSLDLLRSQPGSNSLRIGSPGEGRASDA